MQLGSTCLIDNIPGCGVFRNNPNIAIFIKQAWSQFPGLSYVESERATNSAAAAGGEATLFSGARGSGSDIEESTDDLAAPVNNTP